MVVMEVPSIWAIQQNNQVTWAYWGIEIRLVGMKNWKFLFFCVNQNSHMWLMTVLFDSAQIEVVSGVWHLTSSDRRWGSLATGSHMKPGVCPTQNIIIIGYNWAEQFMFPKHLLIVWNLRYDAIYCLVFLVDHRTKMKQASKQTNKKHTASFCKGLLFLLDGMDASLACCTWVAPQGSE